MPKERQPRKSLWNAAEIQWHTSKAVMTSDGDLADFKELRPLINIPMILAWYGQYDHLEENGDELVGACMLGENVHGAKTSFSVNPKKGGYQCFSCKKRGSIFH